MTLLTALYADLKGTIYDAPGYYSVGRVGNEQMILRKEDMIPLPEGADLMYLPGRVALVAQDGLVQPMPGGLLAVAAILPAGYTRTHLPAYESLELAPQLPLYGYTAIAILDDEIYVAAVKSDDNEKWHPYKYNTPALKKKVAQVRKNLPNNRIVEQLANCALKWHCCTAQNLFYARWEAGVPVSPVCNANCLGCISLQPSECCPSPQTRINFNPTPQEIADVGIYHLKSAPDAIISFGQGCEGEPSLAADNIVKGIKLIREKTNKGIININTNAGYTDGIKAIIDAGLETMRVSIISAIPATYQAYYRSNYQLGQVIESIKYAKQKGVYVSINMLLFPGLNDRPEEIDAWQEFIGETNIDMIQLRNLNMDPEWFLTRMPEARSKACGVKNFINKIVSKNSQVKIGSFSRYVR